MKAIPAKRNVLRLDGYREDHEDQPETLYICNSCEDSLTDFFTTMKRSYDNTASCARCGWTKPKNSPRAKRQENP